MTRNRFIGIYVGFAAVVFLMQVFPLYSLGNRVEPFVLGMPFSMFWIVLWIVIQFVGLLGFYFLGRDIET